MKHLIGKVRKLNEEDKKEVEIELNKVLAKIPKKEEVDIELVSKWDTSNSMLLSAKIFRIIQREKGKYKAKIEVKYGSLELWIGIVGLTYAILADIVRYILSRKKKEKDLSQINIKIDNSINIYL